jgi:hypothetical protein
MSVAQALAKPATLVGSFYNCPNANLFLMRENCRIPAVPNFGTMSA